MNSDYPTGFLAQGLWSYSPASSGMDYTAKSLPFLFFSFFCHSHNNKHELQSSIGANVKILFLFML